MRYNCQHCKQSLPASGFYPASIKYGYNSCRECTDEKRRAHKLNLKPNYKVKEQVSLVDDVKIVKKKTILQNLDDVEYGQIYLIGVDLGDEEEDCFTEPVKIGYTKSSVKNRLSQLNSSHWKPLKVLWDSHTIPWPQQLERYLHETFKKERVGKEWFKLEPWILDEIDEYCELCDFKYDMLKEYNWLFETKSTNYERMEVLEKLYYKLLDPKSKNLDELWQRYWNEDELKLYCEEGLR